MGVVVQEKCSNCNEVVHMPLHCPQMRCPNCKEAEIVNSQRKKSKKISSKRNEKLKKRPHLLISHGKKTAPCPKCGTEFTCSPTLSKGKIFCPKCGNPMVISQEEE